jgi:hypothetical protein
MLMGVYMYNHVPSTKHTKAIEHGHRISGFTQYKW